MNNLGNPGMAFGETNFSSRDLRGVRQGKAVEEEMRAEIDAVFAEVFRAIQARGCPPQSMRTSRVVLFGDDLTHPAKGAELVFEESWTSSRIYLQAGEKVIDNLQVAHHIPDAWLPVIQRNLPRFVSALASENLLLGPSLQRLIDLAAP